MALNVTELEHLDNLIALLGRGGARPKVLCLGYPDVLADPSSWTGRRLAWDKLPKREGVAEVWDGHGRQHLRTLPMIETKGVFEAFGAEPFVTDAFKWGGEDFVLDLNLPLPKEHMGKYDMVVDPGTLEHCFNIAQAFANVDLLLKPGGFVYHQAAIAFPNHGFWSISPMTFFDFYEPLGYELGKPYRFGKPIDANGFVPQFELISPFEPMVSGTLPMVGAFTFRKATSLLKKLVRRNKFPIQRCYSSNARDIPLTDFVVRSASSDVR